MIVERKPRKKLVIRKKPVAARPATSWGNVAGWYDQLLASEGTYQKDVILPNLLRLMGIVPGSKVTDVACGQGFFAAAFLQAGAEVSGCDISPELVELARKNAPGADIYVAPADRLTPFKDASADHVAIVLAIQNIEHDREALTEAARILKPGGRLHLVLNHPAFRIPKRSSWGWDGAAKRQYRRMDGYLTESRAAISMAPGSDPSKQTVSFHRPLQHYVKSLAKAGCAVTNMEEWISARKSDSGPRADEENRTRREFPLFLYLEGTKA
jgi:SAM-dependent methyltransferase